jgi:hypothetical protein
MRARAFGAREPNREEMQLVEPGLFQFSSHASDEPIELP